MELQSVLPALTENQVAVYAISYDPVDALAKFAGKYAITYPLLSDADSAVIRRLGIYNEEAGEQVQGIPHPGVFVLDAQGMIEAKHFYDSYRERETGPSVVEQTLELPPLHRGPVAEAVADAVTVRAEVDSPTYVFGQRLWLTLELAVAPGYHVYGRPIPEGYIPLSVAVDPLERVQIGEPLWPPTTPFRVEGLDEQFHVYAGTLRVRLPVTFMIVDGGTLTLRAQVDFQACTDRDCLPPQRVELEIPVGEAPLIERPPR